MPEFRVRHSRSDGFTQAMGSVEDVVGLVEILLHMTSIQRITMCLDSVNGDASVCWGDSPFQERG